MALGAAYGEAARGNVLSAIAHPTVVNPLAAYQGAAETANAIWNVRKNQAAQAMGQAYQQAVDPQTGRFDPLRFNQILASTPAAAMAAQSGMESSQKLQGEQFNLNTAQRGAINNVATSALLIQDPQQRQQYLQQQGADLITSGMVPADRVIAGFMHMPTDPAGQEAYLKSLQYQTYSPEQKQTLTQGGQATIQTPQATYITPTPPAVSGQTLVTPHGATPGSTTQATEPYDDQGIIPRDANGVPTRQPKGYAPVTKAVTAVPGVPAGGPPQLVGPGATGGPPPTSGAPAGSPPPPPGTHLVLRGGTFQPATPAPSPPRTPVTPAPAPSATPPVRTAAAQPPVITAPPQGQPEEVGASVQHASDARARTLTYQRDIQPVEGAITALAGADTGRASETLNSIRANIQDLTPGFLQRMLPGSLTDPEARKNFEEANKYLTQMQLQAPGGARSDVGTATAGAASPSVHISNAAAREVALAVLAQRRLEQAGTLTFNQSGKSGGEFDRHMGNWVTQADPRAFIVDKMTPDERAAYSKSIGGPGTAAYSRYKQSYIDAVGSGVMQPQS